MRAFHFSYAAAIVLLSCSSGKESMQGHTPLYTTKWSLKKIYTGNAMQLVETKAFIRFDKEKGSAGGNGSCNNFGSTLTVNENEVSFKNIFSTKMYCESVQQTENDFLNRLKNANRFEIKDKVLLLYHDKEKLLEFIAA
jgi:heat shock protein HslJ